MKGLLIAELGEYQNRIPAVNQELFLPWKNPILSSHSSDYSLFRKLVTRSVLLATVERQAETQTAQRASAQEERTSVNSERLSWNKQEFLHRYLSKNGNWCLVKLFNVTSSLLHGLHHETALTIGNGEWGNVVLFKKQKLVKGNFWNSSMKEDEFSIHHM